MVEELKLTDISQAHSGTRHFVKVCALSAYLLGAGMGQSYSAEITCGDVQKLASLAQQNFAKSADHFGDLPRLGADECSIALGEAGARIYFCSYGFDYRSGQARQFFGELERELIACLKPSSAPQVDQRVNHPDSFVQQTYSVDGVDLSMSVKDKSPLQKTFVFFRMQRSTTSAD